MSAAVCGKRGASFFEDQQLLPPATASTPPPSKRARFRSGGGSPSPPRPRVNLGLVNAIQARFPAASVQFIEKALEECGNDFDSVRTFLLNRHAESAECNVIIGCQSPVGMSTGDQVPTEGVLNDNGIAAPVGSVPYAESLPSSSTQWADILVNQMAAASDTDDAKGRVSTVLEVFERSITSRIGAESLQSFQKENSVYKEQFEAVIKENTILKKAVAIQHERQKEHEERSQELLQMKQLIVQYQEQVRSLEVNNYALSMHLRQAQQSSSIPGHFNRHIF